MNRITPLPIDDNGQALAHGADWKRGHALAFIFPRLARATRPAREAPYPLLC